MSDAELEARLVGRRRSTAVEAMLVEIRAGRAELMIGVCLDCELMSFAIDELGEPCPADTTEDRTHRVNYYTLCGIKR